MAEVTEERVDCADGKYTVVLYSDGRSRALRYGEYWPAYGDEQVGNLAVALARDLQEARKQLEAYKRYPEKR